ncbi:acyltransferase [Micromonospora sp. NPDC049559]|uniref:acyltransferase family protein n=1 Tax=Micromonospora sp. NPDC049559 TaxID=3155923 RepID=UPI003445C6CC
MRNRYIDLLRCLAIVRVVVYHTGGWPILTLAFPAMSVMFALAGSLMAASLDRTGPSAVVRRLRRLLPSLWLLAAIFVPAMLLTGGLPVTWRLLLWLAPLHDPPTNSWGALALSAIWYLRDYLWFVLVSPLALWLFRRAPLLTLLAPYVLLVVVELRFPGAPLVLRDFGLYFGAWLIGFAHHDGLLRRLSRRVLVPVVAALATFGAWWALTHQGARGYDLNDIRLANATWSTAFTLVLLALAPAGAAWLRHQAWLDGAVTLLNRRALTIYLWHMPFVIALIPLLDRAGLDPARSGGFVLHLAGVVALVAVAVLLTGWVEDLAARRRPELLPLGAGPARTTGARVPSPRRAPLVAAGSPTGDGSRGSPPAGTEPGTAPLERSLPAPRTATTTVAAERDASRR